tara:strand:+ start:575 stop:1102 length:528 start_codon:yes stop_codon:yes gene_type:complete
MALLPNHFEQFLVLVAQATATTSQAKAVEFQLTAAHQHTENIHSRTKIAHGERQLKSQQIGGGSLCFHLANQHSLQQIHRQQSLGQAGTQELNIHRMGEIPKPTRQGQIHGIHPLQQRHWHGRQQVVFTLDWIRSTGPSDRGTRTGGLLKSFACQLEQRPEHVKVSLNGPINGIV